MKLFYTVLFALLPFLAMGQNDFDTRYFTINASSLPEVPLASSADFSLAKAPFISQKLKTLAMTRENYWEPVDMASAVLESQKFINTAVQIDPINAKAYGLNKLYTADKNSAPVNIVYKETRGLDLLNDCPPFGVCPRCAPYRVGRGY